MRRNRRPIAAVFAPAAIGPPQQLSFLVVRVWNSVEYRWEKPTTPVSEWQTSQKEAAMFNSKVMNAIFNVVSMEEFKRISNVEVAHTAWNILQTVHEGTKAVKINKLQ